MDKKILTKIGVSILATMPLFAFAADVNTVLEVVRNVLNQIIPIIMVLATVVFLWGIVSYITAAGDEKKQATAKNYITYGIIGLFFMVAIWGVVKAIVNTFGVGGQGLPTRPGQI